MKYCSHLWALGLLRAGAELCQTTMLKLPSFLPITHQAHTDCLDAVCPVDVPSSCINTLKWPAVGTGGELLSLRKASFWIFTADTQITLNISLSVIVPVVKWELYWTNCHGVNYMWNNLAVSSNSFDFIADKTMILFIFRMLDSSRRLKLSCVLSKKSLKLLPLTAFNQYWDSIIPYAFCTFTVPVPVTFGNAKSSLWAMAEGRCNKYC